MSHFITVVPSLMLNAVTLIVVALCFVFFLPIFILVSIILVSVVRLNILTPRTPIECRHPERRYAECRGAKNATIE